MITDLRDAIYTQPRLTHPDPDLHPDPYWQVIAGERGFVPNLSISDLLFCEGPATIGILERCRKGNKY